MAKTPLYSTAGASQCIVSGYDPTGNPGYVPTLCSLPLALYVEQRVANRIANGEIAAGSDLNVYRAEELQKVALPGNL